MPLVVPVLALAGVFWAAHAVSGEEPALPSNLSKPIECTGPDELDSGAPVVVRCATKPSSGALTVLLYFRQTGSEDFTAAPTLRTRAGWWTASLCGDSVIAGPFHYYVEARDARNKLVASSGDEDNPHVLVVRAPAKSATVATPPRRRGPRRCKSRTAIRSRTRAPSATPSAPSWWPANGGGPTRSSWASGSATATAGTRIGRSTSTAIARRWRAPASRASCSRRRSATSCPSASTSPCSCAGSRCRRAAG